MKFKYKNGGQVSDGVGLLISILLRYPEIGTINVDQELQLLKLTFFLNKELTAAQQFVKPLSEAISLFNELEGRECRVCELCFRDNEGFLALEVKRDIETVTYNELNLLIDILREDFSDSLLTDLGEDVSEDELLMQEEIIKHMLESLHDNPLDKNMVALREEGRVLVFNT
ncbi:MAG TPA: hypothetical protein VHQ46_03345 [Desulfobacteria bacterium]|nr:hypothetical protein [Desulfobacteria bacterium]